MRTTTVAVRMRIGNYTVHELRDNTVAMGLRFCLHKVVAKNHDQFAIQNQFFWQVPYKGDLIWFAMHHKYSKMAASSSLLWCMHWWVTVCILTKSTQVDQGDCLLLDCHHHHLVGVCQRSTSAASRRLDCHPSHLLPFFWSQRETSEEDVLITTVVLHMYTNIQ